MNSRNDGGEMKMYRQRMEVGMADSGRKSSVDEKNFVCGRNENRLRTKKISSADEIYFNCGRVFPRLHRSCCGRRVSSRRRQAVAAVEKIVQKLSEIFHFATFNAMTLVKVKVFF
ncbi:MAG: hypothetical protein IKG96_06960 [Bacteroidaceae bacterium]|nr:hypothetical protein [Bacteroidaceae bacterium]